MSDTRRHDLTPAQAQAFAEIEAAKRRAALEWSRACLFAGVDPAGIVGGNLRPDDPHFIVRADASAA